MKKFLAILGLILLVSSCAPVATTASPTQVSTATIAPTFTPSPTPQPTYTPTLTPTPKLPALAGTSFPYNQFVISQQNVSHLTNIARWGTGEFIDATYTKDMQKIVVVTASSITYYDAKQGIVIWSKESVVFKAKLSNNGEFLAVVTPSGIELWNVGNGLLVRKLEDISGFICPTNRCYSHVLSPGEIVIDQLEFSPDNKYLGVQVNEKRTYFWGMPAGDLLLTAPSGKSFSFSPNSSLVAISTTHEIFNIYKTANWESLYTLKVPDVRWDVPIDLIFSPDSSLLMSISQFGANQIIVLDMTNGKVIRKFGASKHRYLTFISENEIGIEDKSGNRMIDIESGIQTKLPGEFRFLSGSDKAYDHLLGFSEDKEIVAIGILDTEKSTDFDRLTSITEIQIWNINRNEIIQTLPLEGKFPECQFLDGQNFLACISSEKFIEWEVKTGQAIKEVSFDISLAGSGVVFSPDATMLQAGNDIVDVSSGKTIFSSNDCCLGFSSNNVPIKLDETGDLINIINVQTGEKLNTLATSSRGAIYHLSPDGAYLGIERDRSIQFWRISDGKFVSSTGRAAWWVHFNYSPDGKIIGFANRNGGVDINKGLPILIQDISGEPIIKLSGGLMDDSLAFSSDNKLAAISGSDDAKIYSIPDGQLIGRVSTSLPCQSMAFSINNDLLFCGLEIGIIQIFSVSGMNVLSKIPAHSNSVTSLWLSPNGMLLGSGSSDGTSKLWAIYP